MNLENICLLLAAIINLIMSILVISRGWKNKVNLYFSLLAFFNFLWALSLFLSTIILNAIIAEMFYRTAYLAAIGIAVSLFYFALHFPYTIKRLKVHNNLLVLFFSAIVLIFVYSKLHIISFERDLDLANWVIDYYKPFYVIYSLFFFLLIVLAVYFLLDKLHNLESWLKKRVKILLITIIVGLIFGIYFDLVLCYFGNLRYIGFGPIFTSFMNITVFYFIYSSRDKITKNI